MKTLLSALLFATAAFAAEFPPVTIGGMEFTKLEVAVTDQERQIGLMDRYWLDEDGGMLFVYGHPQPVAMWMKNTRIPLDCLFLDASGRVLKAITMKAEPPRGPTESEADYEKRLPVYRCDGLVGCVVELREGMIRDLGIRVGERIPALSLRRILPRLKRHEPQGGHSK